MLFQKMFLILMGFIPSYCSIDDREEMRRTGELRKACSKWGNAKLPATRVNTTVRLLNLRKYMTMSTALGDVPIDAYIITSDDEHQSEEVDPYDRRREYISGFSGGSGTAIVTTTKAALWTDGRYHLEADDQMSCDWLLMREGQRFIPTMDEWLKREFPKGARIGVDPKFISEVLWNHFQSKFNNTELKLVEIYVNVIDLIWIENRPAKLHKDVFILEEKFAGKSWTRKVKELRNKTKELNAEAMIISALDEIAWLLNIRGRDIPFSPFVRSYVLVDKFKVIIYINETQLIKHHVRNYFSNGEGVSDNSVVIKDYEDIWLDLRTQTQAYQHILIPSLCVYSLGASHAIYSLIPKHKQLPTQSPIIFMKAVKNPTEIRGMHNAHIRDAAAICDFFAYFRDRFKEDVFTELDVVQMLNEYRFAQELSIGNSFRTIVAFGSNAAYPDYQTTYITNRVIFGNGTLVLDSGGQYQDGTTDFTRTVHMGNPTEDQKRAYTRVLIGLIQMSTLTFPEHMQTAVADVMVRAPLWEVGLDYLHGTSHGVGSFLGVHESPISVHFDEHKHKQTFKPGYFFTIEPGYYSEGEFGIRLENVLEVIEKPWLTHTSGYGFLGFKDVTLVPYEAKLMDLTLMSPFHRRWLNNYNQRIRELVGKELKKQSLMNGFQWMMDNTKYIPENGGCMNKTHPLLSVLFFILFFFIL